MVIYDLYMVCLFFSAAALVESVLAIHLFYKRRTTFFPTISCMLCSVEGSAKVVNTVACVAGGAWVRRRAPFPLHISVSMTFGPLGPKTIAGRGWPMTGKVRADRWADRFGPTTGTAFETVLYCACCAQSLYRTMPKVDRWVSSGARDASSGHV